MTEIFSQTPLWSWWLILGILLVIFDIFISSLILIWFAFGALCAMIFALIPNVTFPFQLTCFGIASLVGLFLLRPYIKASNDVTQDKRELNNFKVNLVGSSGILTEAIEGGRGRARIGDSTWTVTGPELPAKTRIRVTSVDGIKLGVKADSVY